MCTACACGTDDKLSAQAAPGDVSVYTVGGMTCGHCASSVSAEIGRVAGVTGVSVDLATGAVSVSRTGLSDDEIRAAVDRAGYTLAGAPAVTTP